MSSLMNMAHRKTRIFSIGARTILLSMMLVLVTSTGIGITFYYGAKDALVSQEVNKIDQKIQHEIAMFKSDITELGRDALFVSSTPPFQGILRATNNNGIDPLDGSTTKRWKSRLSQIFIKYLEAKPHYVQLRYITIADGERELVRVDRDISSIKVVNEERLQKNGVVKYLQYMQEHRQDKVHLTAIEHMKDQGGNTSTVASVIKAVVPVLQDNGTLFGLAIIDMDVTDSVYRLKNAQKENDTEIFITDKKGHYFKNTEMNDESNPELDTNRLIYKDYPDLESYYLAGNKKNHISLNSNVNNKAIIVTIDDVFHPLMHDDGGLKVVSVNNFKSIENKINAIGGKSLFIALMLLVAGVVAAGVFSRKLTKSLSVITEGIVAFGRGERTGPLLSTNDELGVLSDEFSNMQAQLKARGEELRNSEQRFVLAIEGSSDGIWDWDLKNGEFYLSLRWKSMLGYSDSEIENDFLTVQSLIHPDDLPLVLDAWTNCMEGIDESFSVEYRIQAKNGEYHWVQCRGMVLIDASGEPARMAGSQTDITDRKESEVYLKKVKSRLQFLFDNMPGVIYSAAASGDYNINFVSENVIKMLGYKSDEIIADYNFWFKHIYPEDIPAMFERLIHLSEEKQQAHEYRILCNDGQYRWVHDVLKVIYNDDGDPIEVIGSLTEITERKQMEDALRKEKTEQALLIEQLQEAQDQLLQSEKMASIGQLAAGVAHEINNPVGYINSNIGSLKQYINSLLKLFDVYERAEDKLTDTETKNVIQQSKQDLDLDYIRDDIRDLIAESEEGVARVKQIVEDLKDFSHVDEAEWQWADLHKGIDSTLNVVSNEIKYKADIIKEYGNLPQVECLISQLNQVFMNLLVNAAQAIDDNSRGTITISTGCEEDGIWIGISDSGKGMDADTQKRIFEPFYTTKPVGKGTGLGLSLSYSIIQKHHGSINVDSEVGKGTAFLIWLPVQQEQQKAAS